MSEENTPTANKTPFRRLGLVRSIKKSGSTSTPVSREVLSTPISALGSNPNFDKNVSSESSPSPLTHQMRPIKSTCSDGTSDPEDNVEVAAPVTPINIRASSKKTRLSLSQSWRNRITQKKELQNIKRRKLMDEVEKCEEVEETRSCVPPDRDPCIALATTSSEGVDKLKPSSIKQQIQEVKESISIWRTGCIEALNDLQTRRGTGDMESLLNMLQIPFELVNFDREAQEFLDPD
ncbi:uncharacterized protein LOC109427681 isoform X1 [Aedes albopictus]|uniref:Swi5-dependent recombination DNA repair protein 1 homolog n=1 Tax=Aedes albopictus TaxID=7160 RepID=A0ABM1Y554_AEDAL